MQVIHNCYAVLHVGLEHPRSLVVWWEEGLEAGTSCLQILKDDCNEQCLLFFPCKVCVSLTKAAGVCHAG